MIEYKKSKNGIIFYFKPILKKKKYFLKANQIKFKKNIFI